jgi:DnaJ-class molecular chaperone
VKKAYRKLAKLYHPDKVKQMSLEDQNKNKEKWNGIIRAYETLTE